jgi:hypothetical protein
MTDETKRFELLANIMRASHFEWRRAALALCPELSPDHLVKRYWEEVGRDTARYYLTKIDRAAPLARQVAALVVSSSVAMGETAEVLDAGREGHYYVRHTECPWYTWHKREDLLEEDQLGCDHWLETVIREINTALGASLRFRTTESLPGGGTSCLRLLWEEAD